MEFEDPTVRFWDRVDPDTGKIVDGGMENMKKADFIVVLPNIEGARKIKVYRQKNLQSSEPKSIEQLINAVQLPPKSAWEVLP